MALCGHDIVGDDPRSPLEFRLCGRLGCRGGGLALVPVRLCRTHFQALNERKTDAAAAHSKLVAVDRGVRLRRHCGGRRAGSRWLDCIGTVGVLVFPATIKRLARSLWLRKDALFGASYEQIRIGYGGVWLRRRYRTYHCLIVAGPLLSPDPKVSARLDLLLRPYANHIDGDFLDFRASARVFDFNRQDIIAQEFRR